MRDLRDIEWNWHETCAIAIAIATRTLMVASLDGRGYHGNYGRPPPCTILARVMPFAAKGMGNGMESTVYFEV